VSEVLFPFDICPSPLLRDRYEEVGRRRTGVGLPFNKEKRP